MAANNFATKLSRNTNRITVILVYAFLEWLLMFFIFLNSLFTYFIVRFASFFGLKQVCLLCPKLDRIFERNSENRFTYYRELLCENHVAELASLSFCKTHGKTSESANLCSDCSNREEERSNIGLGFCTCCQKSLAEKPYPNYLLIKSSIWGKTLGRDGENGGLILEMIDDEKFFGDGFEVEREPYPLGPFFRGKAEEEGKRQELQQNGEVISDVESYGLSLREVSEEDGLRSIISNINSPGNEEEIPEAKSRVSEDEQRDDDTSNVETHGKDQISVLVEEKEEEGANLLADQFESKNFTGSQNEEEEEEDREENTKELDPETPTSVSTLFNKKLLFLARNEYAGDESVLVSEMDGGDPLKTIERLRETVRAEQEALRDLYAELEEERSASAISANQTMAMITRLQEEKAKVQMEALQYQRMMEEQAEYDQEALQLLNHLMVKREKEKEQLQRELEVYREKVLEYESKATNKITITKNNGEAADDDGKKEENGEEDTSSETDVDLEKITLDCVQHMSILGESLSEFEEERLVILDQLRVLEDRLVTMQDNDQSAEDPKFSGEFSNSYDQEESYSEHEGQTMASMAKSLLPLLDSAENESEDGYQELAESVEKNFGSESEKLEIIKQVDSVYERLQVLETDGEFLKNCMSSAKKGDKGTDILKDILQHLRDLRTIELTDTIENQTTEED
ncbi:PREDICTED: myosin-binding protein 3-like [Camelina sativa]|uniref:Myosin-binding protein 3-like n=1 Tax=Camelina sativa TaxID=90675 RepID=A0ABM0VBR5_CAMSA|nr:PREDICTED: myosin-binding protein 3-like [Camelina sativa]